MQLLERSFIGLRSARLVFRRASDDVEITLFPMVHVGEAQFFEAVYKDALLHDAVLIEGVSSKVVKRLTRSYRWLKHSSMGLVTQPAFPRPSGPKPTIICADISTSDFEREWASLPLALRLMTQVGSTAIGIRGMTLQTRKQLSRSMSLNYRKSRNEILSWTPFWSRFTRLILDLRDREIAAHLRSTFDRPTHTQTKIAVVYGASHMRAVIDTLREEGFAHVQSDWLTVFHH